jgi:DNA-binding transcriptional LysR family regulator
MRAEHSACNEPLTLESFAAQSHVIVSPNGNWKTPIDGILAEHGLCRRVTATVPALGQALQIVRASQCVTTMPSALVRSMAPELTALQLPIEMPPLEHSMWWNPRTTRSSRHRWLREEVRAVAEESFAGMTPASAIDGVDSSDGNYRSQVAASSGTMGS